MDCDENHVVLNVQSVLNMYGIVKQSDPYIVDMTTEQLYFAIEELLGISHGKPLRGSGGRIIFKIVDRKKWMVAQLKYAFE